MANLAQEPAEGDLDLSTVPIPERARMPAFALTMAWWAVCSAVFYNRRRAQRSRSLTARETH